MCVKCERLKVRMRRSDEESGGEIDWDKLGFGLTPTDYMYVMRCSREDRGDFPHGELCRYGNIELSPSSGVLNYAQVRCRPGYACGLAEHTRSVPLVKYSIDDGDTSLLVLANAADVNKYLIS